MKLIRFYFTTLLIVWPLFAMSQNADFVIQNFRESMTDLSAATSDIKDLNGKTAALIRFSVRDPNFVVDANNGILKQESKVGEIWVYVPVGTKRLDIRHPSLGIIRGYEIGMSIKSKLTYEADIVITNEEYLQKILSGEQNDGQVSPVMQETSTEQQLDDQVFNQLDDEITDSSSIVAPVYLSVVDSIKPLQVVESVESKPSQHIRVMVGMGFNAISLMGPSAHLGIGYGAFRLEAGYVFGFDKVKDIAFTASGAPMPAEIYDYSCNKLWVRIGGVLNSKSKFKVTPQVGVAINMIKGKVTGGSNNSHYYQKSNPMSVFGALRLSYDVANWLSLHVTPQYDFALSNDEVYGVIKTVDNKIKSWGEGFGVNAGILFHF